MSLPFRFNMACPLSTSWCLIVAALQQPRLHPPTNSLPAPNKEKPLQVLELLAPSLPSPPHPLRIMPSVDIDIRKYLNRQIFQFSFIHGREKTMTTYRVLSTFFQLLIFSYFLLLSLSTRRFCTTRMHVSRLSPSQSSAEPAPPPAQPPGTGPSGPSEPPGLSRCPRGPGPGLQLARRLGCILADIRTW